MRAILLSKRYRVRRIYEMGKNKQRQPYPAKMGQVSRTVKRMEVFPIEGQALKALEAFAKTEGLGITTTRGIPYAHRECCETTYPTREGYFTIAPALVETKARFRIPWFNGLWETQQRSLFAA